MIRAPGTHRGIGRTSELGSQKKHKLAYAVVERGPNLIKFLMPT